MPESGTLPVLALGLLRGAEGCGGSGSVAERCARGGYAVAGAEEEK